ncbi:MAG TPA: PilZ domain-containing protein, partial [Polyangiaceae bacterium]
KGGTFIRTTKPLEVGTEFMFVLSLPATDAQVKLRGKVMWVTTEAEADEKQEKPPGMGIRFLFKDDGERNAVDDYVEKLMSEALGEHISTKLLAKKDPDGA